MFGMRILVIFLFSCLYSNAQNYTYLNSSGKKIPNEENAFTRFEIKPVNDSVFSVYKAAKFDGKWGKIKLQYSALKKSEQVFFIFENDKLKGDHEVLEIMENLTLGYRIKLTSKNNEINFIGDVIQIFPTILHGKCTFYDIYEMPMVENAYNSGLKISEKLLFHPVDSNLTITKLPEFPGGSRNFYTFIAENLKYPIIAIEKNIKEEVYIRFLINPDGKMTDFSAASNANKELIKEGVRVISSMDQLWEPAFSDEKKIPVWHYAKITYGGSFILR